MYEIISAHNHLRVSENEGVRLLRFAHNRQSSMYVADPFETDFEYPTYLHVSLAVKPAARRTLVIGLGGGSVVKRMWRDYPWMHIDTVEIDAEVIEVARTYFALPEDDRIDVITCDGRQFVEYSTQTYDIIIVDAFDDDRIPRPLLTEEFMRAAVAVLEPRGVVAWNVIGSVYGPHSRPFRSLYRTASNVWRNVWVFAIGLGDDATDKSRNIVMLASDAELTDEELLERIASRVDGLVTVPKFEQCSGDLFRGKVRSGDVPILSDHRPGKRKRR